jgi:hypothetical protein
MTKPSTTRSSSICRVTNSFIPFGLRDDISEADGGEDRHGEMLRGRVKR